MIASSREPELMVTTSVAHVELVADRHGLPVVSTATHYYTVLQVAVLGQPIIYRAEIPAAERLAS